MVREYDHRLFPSVLKKEYNKTNEFDEMNPPFARLFDRETDIYLVQSSLSEADCRLYRIPTFKEGRLLACEKAAEASRSRTRFGYIRSIRFSCARSSAIFVEATKLEPVVALFGCEAQICPPNLSIRSDMDAYGPLTPGSITQVALEDLTGRRMTVTWAAVVKGPDYKGLMTVYALRKHLSEPTLVMDVNAPQVLGWLEEDMVQMGRDLKYIPDDNGGRREFHAGLELIKVNVKALMVPRRAPPVTVSAMFEDALDDVQGLSILYMNDLERFRDDKVAPGQTCKIIQGPMSGHSAIVEHPYEAHPKIPGRVSLILYKGTKGYRLSTKPSYIRTRFELFDEVSGRGSNGRRFAGWLVGMAGRKARIWDKNSHTDYEVRTDSLRFTDFVSIGL